MPHAVSTAACEAVDGPALQELLDRQAVSDTVSRYATGIDMRQWDVHRSCFTGQVDIDFTSFGGATGDDFWRGLGSARAEHAFGSTATQHMLWSATWNAE